MAVASTEKWGAIIEIRISNIVAALEAGFLLKEIPVSC
jgi:hypothetical protein